MEDDKLELTEKLLRIKPFTEWVKNNYGYSVAGGMWRHSLKYDLILSIVQKWLREEHHMHILMNVGMNDGEKQTFYCNVFLFGKNLYKGKFRSETSVYTYEEALEVGLLNALKLIK